MAPAGSTGNQKKLAGFGRYRRGFFFGFFNKIETFPAADED
jgi:hypothetical protein